MLELKIIIGSARPGRVADDVIPSVLKNALDSVFATFGLRDTPCLTVTYSGGPIGGARAVEHLALVASAAFDAEGMPRNPRTDAVASLALDDLAWWGRTLGAGREANQLPPAPVRLMAAANHD